MSKHAIYAGTFDPITNGHRDIVLRALKVFDQLTIAVANAPAKALLFEADDRVKLVKGALADVEGRVTVEKFDGLLVDYVRKKGAKVIIRGLRAVSDYEYEAQMAIMNGQLSPELETVFLMTSAHCSFISSSVVKEVARHGGAIGAFVPENVARELKSRFGQKS